MRSRNRAAAVVLGALLLAGPVATASAVTASAATQDGTWWYTGMGVAEVNAAGADGRGVTVAVIDDAINPDLPMFAGADLHVHEPSFCTDHDGQPLPAARPDIAQSAHGTAVTGFVVGNGQGFNGERSQAGVAPRARVLFYSQEGTEGLACGSGGQGPDAPSATARAIRQAVDDGADIISMSFGGAISYEEPVQDVIAWALKEGVVVLAALAQDSSSNDTRVSVSDDLARLNGVVAVEACDVNLDPQVGRDGKQFEHEKITVCAPGVDLLVQGSPSNGSWEPRRLDSGTSLATPVVAGALAAVWSAYPEATGNQMLQTLIHDTGSEEHELGYDEMRGYGMVGLRHMLREDPARFPDENPLLVDIGEGEEARLNQITLGEVAAAERPVWPGDPEATSAPEASATATGDAAPPAQDAPEDGQDVGAGWLWPALGGAAAVLVAVVVTVLLLQRRRRTAGPAPAPLTDPGR
ncbi:S8 family serine peptidase [Cellulomonas sp. JZ18]|uniref:S8 family peptidase n=1 Tax=Cellulomonas sp. JZ18 TaxID=2654191 RepID=UPI0012D3DC27|nr:S8/S53 family peptidase [Cellulomonas sp. JZ18]QGQ19960.1 S8 family serine peptidase [Cellulomonas sp. JZ18]